MDGLLGGMMTTASKNRRRSTRGWLRNARKCWSESKRLNSHVLQACQKRWAVQVRFQGRWVEQQPPYLLLPCTDMFVSRSQPPKTQPRLPYLSLLRPTMCPLQAQKHWSDGKPSFPKRRRSSLRTPWSTMNMTYTTLRHHLRSGFAFSTLILGKK